MPSRSPRRLGSLALAAAVAAVGLAATVAPEGTAGRPERLGDGTYSATIRRSPHGVPHVRAGSYGDLGFGFGHAFASDNLCTMAETYVTVAGERSRWFGPDGTWTLGGNGTENTNLDSDFHHRWLEADGTIQRLLDQPPPQGPRPEVRALVRGYVAGYNRYLASVGGADGVDDPRCQGQPWVRPITEADAYRRFLQLASLASAGAAIDEMGGAQPPTPGSDDASHGAGSGAAVGRPTAAQRAAVAELPDRLPLGVGSNAIALGGEVTDDGHGMLLANPHFPWHGSERLYQARLQIPGELDVSGATLYGVPLVLLGHTDGVAWSHTVSTAYRFTPFELTLAPGSPTTYLVDGEPIPMEETRLTVPVREPDGSVGVRHRTLYSTRHGRVFTGVMRQPLFPWTPTRAWAMGDANVHLRFLNTFFRLDHAQSTHDVERALDETLGIPWANTLAADRAGRAYYGDLSVVPNVPDALAERCGTALGQATFGAIGLPVLDGSRSSCRWEDDADAPASGIFGPRSLPDVTRRDYVLNANDSHWLPHPDDPLTGYPRILGEERSELSLRSRLAFAIVRDRLAGTDEYADRPGTPDGRWTQDLLQEAMFDNRHHGGELTRDAAVALCRSFGDGAAPSSQGPVELGDACDVLADWPLRDDLDASGALLFRRFLTRALQAQPTPWVNGFDPDDPLRTPNTLHTDHPQVRMALGDAVSDLREAGIPLDAGLRGWQYETFSGRRISLHGGPAGLGVFNDLWSEWDPERGYAGIRHGASFVMAVQLGGRCPDADGLLAYSQSSNPRSPWFVDQTRLYARKQWVAMASCRR